MQRRTMELVTSIGKDVERSGYDLNEYATVCRLVQCSMIIT